MNDDRQETSAVPSRPEDRLHSAQDVRQGEIILRTPLRRWIFIGGLLGIVVLVLVLRLWGT